MADAKTRPFPLDKGHHFGPNVISRTGHSGALGGDADQVRLLQRTLGLKETGRYDQNLTDAVVKAQKKAKIIESGVVDEATWKALKIEG